MSDPFDALRADYRPVAPDAAFAARLRATLELAVLGRSGANMSTEAKPVVVDTHTPHDGDLVYSALLLPDAARGEAFYRAVLDWRFETDQDPQRRRITNVNPQMGLWGDVADGTLFLCHAVDDIEAAVARVRELGGTADEPTDHPYGRIADCVDNQGMPFALQAVPATRRPPTTRPGQGELLYLTIQTPNSARFREFYGPLFGWTFTPGRVRDGWNIQGQTPMSGLSGGAGHPAVIPMYGVRDIVAAVAAVRQAGGTSTEPEEQPYGTTAECVDDQGQRFYLGQI
jgi:uncharacterized protein